MKILILILVIGMILIPMSTGIIIEENLTFHPSLGGLLSMNATSYAFNITINQTCVIFDGTKIFCPSVGVEENVSVTTTTTTISTTTTTLVGDGRFIVDLESQIEADTGSSTKINISTLSEICFKIYRVFCINLSSNNWSVYG